MSDKLDRLVAEKVMNWRVHARNTAWWVDADVETGLVTSGGVRGLTSGMDRWSPTTSIKTAWEVVEHLRKQRRDCGWRKYLVSIIDHMTDMEVTVQTMGGNDIAVSRHESAPMAICHAALRAVGVPEATIQEACK